MKLGDQVILYVHEVNDGRHSTVDSLAFVTLMNGDQVVEVVAFPAGGPVQFLRVPKYDPKDEHPVGYTYWREANSQPPNFERPKPNEPRPNEPRPVAFNQPERRP